MANVASLNLCALMMFQFMEIDIDLQPRWDGWKARPNPNLAYEYLSRNVIRYGIELLNSVIKGIERESKMQWQNVWEK